MLLTRNNIISELSYGYVHAVAARAGMACEVAGRHSDGDGVDAMIRVKERLAVDAIFTSFAIFVQLKATAVTAAHSNGRYPFRLRKEHYDKLRLIETPENRILVVLFLPETDSEWLVHGEESMLSRRCAYWVSLRGAPATANDANLTVYIPKANVFSPEGLRRLMCSLARGEKLIYDA